MNETNHAPQPGIPPALLGGGELGQRIRTYDWSTTPLGPIETWPAALHTAAGIVLGARAAMAIGWGPDLILLYNDAWAVLVGDRHPGALGQPAQAVFPGVWETVGPLLARVMAGQGAAELHSQRLAITRHGRHEEAWFDYTFSPIPCAGRTVGGVLCVAAETTDRVRAEEALREAGQQYSELVHCAPAAIYSIDLRNKRLTSVNGAMCHMTGYSREELLAMDPFDLTDAEGRALFSRRIQQWLSGVEPDGNVEFRVKAKDGRTMDTVLDLTFTADDEGRPLGATVVAHDITERKRRERQIGRYNDILRGINRIFEQVIRSETEEALGETCLDVALEITGSQVGFVGEVGADGFLHDVAISDTGWAQCQVIDQEGHRRPPGDFVIHGLYGRVFDDGKGFFANEPSSHPDSIGVPPGHLPLASFLGVPLVHDGKMFGMLAVANREGGYGAEQQEDLEALAPAVVEALVRRRAEEALRDSEEKARWLARFPAENPNPVLRVSGDGTVMYANAAAVAALDGRCQVGHPLSHDGLRGLVGQALADGRALEQDVQVGGATFRVAAAPVADQGYVNVYGIDITARKQVEEALRQYAERLRLLREVDEAILAARSAREVAQAVVEGVPRLLPCLRASVLMRDQETGEMLMLAVVHRGESKLGADQRETLGPAESGVLERLAHGETFVVDDLQASSFSASALAQLKAEGVRAQVFEPIRIGGQLVGTLAVSMDLPGPVPVDQQDVLHDLALQLAVGLEQVRLYEAVQRYAGDLEQLVQQRTAALEASEARFRTIFEEAAIGIALTDADGILMATNPAMQRMLGYGEDELIGMRIFDFSRSVDEPRSMFPEELLSGQRSEYTLEQAYSRRNGEVGQANVTMSVLHRDTEQAPLVLILAEDITERVRAQEALIRAEKLAVLGRMTTSLAHEINNPIQSVVGCLSLAMEVLVDGEDATRFMEAALEESERAARIVHRLRDLTRSEEVLREPADVGELVDTVLALTQNQAHNTHVALFWEGEDDLPLVPMVRDRIQQVFLNLVLNAIDAMPGGGELHVHATRTQDPPGVSTSFTDTGVGMSPEQVGTLFEGLRTTKEMGLGLGLHVSRNIVREHGGHIDVDSQPGHGTIFTVWLPLP